MRTVMAVLALVFYLLIAHATPSFALNIVLNNVGGVDPGSSAEAGFQAAAARWEALFSDPVTVRLDVGFEPLGSGILGSASSNTVGASYSTIRAGLIGDATSSGDATAVANLPGGDYLRFRTNNSAGTVILDQNGSGNNSTLDVNRANFKALGLLADDPLIPDAEITFSSSFSFDFDPTNGISAGAIDFVGVATHEIGHALGFVSGVDIVDITRLPYGPYAPYDLNSLRVFSVLDLFRYSADSLALGSGILDLATGGTPYFSINGGATALGSFATGYYNGDGRQASHWKDNLGLGILDPTFSYGELGVVTALDIQALDVIGWNLASVPEPHTLLLLGSGLLGLGGLAWRRTGRQHQ